MNLHLKRPISDLTVGGRTFSTLVNMGLKTVGDLVQKTPNELYRTPGFGKVSMNQVLENLREMDLELGMDANGVKSLTETKEKTELFHSLSKSIANKCEDSLRASMAKMLEAEGYVDKYDAIQEHRKILNSYEVAIHNSTEG